MSAELEIQTNYGPRMVRAYGDVTAPLVVTKSWKPSSPAVRYTVTHRASGWAAAHAPTIGAARALMVRLLACGDWARSRTALQRDKDLVRRAIEVRS